ncbi:hypothetical protein DBR32_03105 [Taibaiella sp. KBW10]|uniref:hypothetical protein n=1 Tax=Taibaiella sp. KBW10 TaxID=2153357 RepID=UPI000F5B02C4|nr:hypothetical protein [Taibaiella sp. KBW10]RQO32598.1 hypothetical protein DBR32_03105 [Taibaiella sp. KBW10]
MKKSYLFLIIVMGFSLFAQAQISDNFAQEVNALICADIETIKGLKEEKSVTTAYQSTLPLNGFKVLLKESFGDYRVSCFYKGTGNMAVMDSIATTLSKLRNKYILIDSKEHRNLLELNKNGITVARRIILVDITEKIKAEIELWAETNGTLSVTIYKYDRKLLKE